MLEYQRLQSIIEFAQECARLKERVVSDIEKYDFHVHEHTIKALPGFQVNTTTYEEGGVWVSVDRLQPTSPPAVKQKLLIPWIKLSNDPSKSPKLINDDEIKNLVEKENISKDYKDIAEGISIDNYPHKSEIELQLKEYIETHWKPWAEEEKKRRRSISLYDKLFELKHLVEGSIADSQLEIIFGVGIAIWDKDGTKICHPLITYQTEICWLHDEKRTTLAVRPKDAEPSLEMNIFSAENNPGTADIEKKFKEELALASEKLTHFDFSNLLKFAAATLDSRAVYWPSQVSPDDRELPQISDSLTITDTWVLFARPRSKSTLVQDLEKFKAALEDGKDIILPKPIKAVLTEPSTKNEEVILPSYRGLSFIGSSANLGGNSEEQKIQDLYFTKPFNDEQVRIVQMLDCYDGVVVQGPPGTGKTHTIANIISHYFALGKRILVTSMKEHPLSVIREKLPNELQPLVISLLNNEQEEKKQFKDALTKIISEIQTIDQTKYKYDIEQSEQKINSLHQNLSDIDNAIKDLAKRNLDPIIIDDTEISPVEAAKELLDNEGYYEWLEDKIGLENDPQFNNSDISKLRVALRKTEKDMDYLGGQLPDLESFPDTNELLRIHEDLLNYAQLTSEIAISNFPLFLNNDKDTLERASDIVAKINKLLEIEKEISSSGASWIITARRFLVQKSTEGVEVIKIFDELGKEIFDAISRKRDFLIRPVEIPEGLEFDEEIYEALKNKAKGKTPFGLKGLLGKSNAKSKIKEIRIECSQPKSADEWQYVLSYVDLQRYFRTLLTRWNTIAKEIGIETYLNFEQMKIKNAYDIHREMRLQLEIAKYIDEQAKVLFPKWESIIQVTADEKLLLELKEHIENHAIKNNLSNAQYFKEKLQDSLRGYQGKIIGCLQKFFNETLGNPVKTSFEMQREWFLLNEELERVHGLKSFFDDILEITNKIEKSGGVKWAKAIRAIRSIDTINIVLPETWNKSWKLRRLATFLESLDGSNVLKELIKNRKYIETRLAQEYQANIAKRTWLKLVENATPDIQSALAAYSSAITKIGKGNGKRAIRYRQDARKAARSASPVIPCWIMPHWRVSETLPADFGCFDLVIIDEASQSDISALPSLLRAKKVLIVGDDEQVSPEGVGIEEDKIVNLKKRYLHNQVDNYGEQIAPDRSIYDLFKVVFASSSTMLREHFRCVSPIIEYSKREFYNHELKPLRLPKPSERLDPPLIDVFIEDGLRDGDINESEAFYIVSEIKKICDDENMKNRSIGVVSLLGDKQAHKIWELLEKHLGSEKIELHQISCGDAKTFQGKERDIMFISLVVSPGDAHARNSDSMKQRFNVAASRARDRMYLVRSIQLDDLSKNDVIRRNLLSHFVDPFVNSYNSENNTENPRDLCESEFERELYDILTNKGYNLRPKVKIGEYRIDFVVEGHNDARLAIECDGDGYHDSEKWDDEMHKQRILERVGWQFWRCFASNFVKNKHEVISDLIGVLAEMGIQPIEDESPQKTPNVEFRRINGIDFCDSIKSYPLNEDDVQKPFETEKNDIMNCLIDDDQTDFTDDNKVIKHISTFNSFDEIQIREYIPAKLDDILNGINPEEFFHYSQSNIISEIITRVIKEEGPISLSLLSERVARAYSFKRTGNKIIEHVRMISIEKFPYHNEKGEDFFWPSYDVMNFYNECRTSSYDNEHIRRIEDICTQELQMLARYVAKNVKPIDREQHMRAMADKLGYKRITANISNELNRVIFSIYE